MLYGSSMQSEYTKLSLPSEVITPGNEANHDVVFGMCAVTTEQHCRSCGEAVGGGSKHAVSLFSPQSLLEDILAGLVLFCKSNI